MKMTITLDLENADFENGGTDAAQILISSALEDIRGLWATSSGVEHAILDSSGGKVGQINIVP
jgi:hypothetical protein